ncbi:hypothetical protein [Taklimakanibacter deserti]|uniref:hypothetical protein n=1 Tax=Taklimakanibacter deserti TaxID=2267839 RepID=UPI0013C4EB34
MTRLERKIIHELHSALNVLDAPPGYLAAISSYKDTVPDKDVLRMLMRMNETQREEVGERMDCYVGQNNDEVAPQLVKDMSNGAGRTNCFICNGSGRWHPDEGTIALCINCDGSGKVFVSV